MGISMAVSMIYVVCLAQVRCREVKLEPVDRQTADLLERSGLLEEMGGARHDHDRARAAKLPLGLTVELEHLPIGPADDQQRRRSHRTQVQREIGTPTARDDGAHMAAQLTGRRQRGGRSRAGAEEAER